MRKNYFLSLFNQTSGLNKALKKLTFAFLFCVLANFASAQTALISASDGGFENATTTFAANGWAATLPTVAPLSNKNQWYCGTAASTGLPAGYGGTQCVYITNNTTLTPPPFAYTNGGPVRYSHVYRTINFPVGQTIINLSFKWTSVGDANDRMTVFLVPTTSTPTNTTDYTTASVGQYLIGTYASQATWTTANVVIPASYAGTSYQLVFQWKDITSGTTLVPAAIDDITLTSAYGFPDDCISARLLSTNATCSLQSFTNVGATNSTDTAPTCGQYNGQDIWFKAYANCNGDLTVTTEGNGGLVDVGIALYSGSCGSLSLIQCKDDDVFGVDLFPSVTLTGRAPNELIYIRVWDYQGNDVGTFDICTTAANCFAPNTLASSNVLSTTATIGWNPTCSAPANGYAYYYSTTNASPSGLGTASATASVNLSGLTPYTTYYWWVRSDCGGGNYSPWIASSFQTAIPNPTTTGANICQGGVGTLTASAYCTNPTNLGTTINGALNASTDPVAPRPPAFVVSGNACSFAASTSNYTSLNFTVTTTGTYVFTMNLPSFDAMAYITTSGFVAGNCAGGGTYIAGDDDTGPVGNEPQVTATLTAGTQYTLYTTCYGLSSTTASGSFTYNVSGPGTISATTAGVLQWWTASSGGTMIGTGTPFNPVGVAGSGLANTNTAGTTTFYAACSAYPNIRTGANFVVNGTLAPSSVISGTGSACSSTTVSIALSGASPWTLTYTDGTTPVTVSGISASPYTFSASPGVATTYTVSALSNTTCGTAAAANRTGSAVLYVKTWNGGSNNWNTAANWNPTGVPTSSDCVVIANAAIQPIISGTNFYAFANRLTVNNSAVLRVNASNSLTVTEGVTVAATAPVGNIILDDDSSLVQVTDVVTNNNTGNITFNRTTNIVRTDYVYWSSPFSALNVASISPGTSTNFIYKWDPSIANSNGGQGNWVNGNDSPMTVGKGYIVRSPDTHPYTPTDYTATVNGRPNNGVITTTIGRGSIVSPMTGNNGVAITATDDNWNLVGNPYPSSIDAVKFLTDNNSNLSELSVRLWTHNSPIGGTSSSFYNSYNWGYSDSYTRFNISGPNPPGFGGKIASGQGFFILSNETSPSIVFNNTMRRFDHDNSQFFRTSNANVNLSTLERSRIWLSILNEANVNATTMVCYVDGATMEKDRLFDAPYTQDSSIGIYSLIGNEGMNIQGRPAFDQSDIVPLGYSVEQNGIFKIAIADVDGLFENAEQDIYLEDTALGIMHNLRANYYTFTTNSGTFDTRFKLHFRSTALGNPQHDEMNTFTFINNNILNIRSLKNIEQVEIHDITGKLIKSCRVSDVKQNFETDFNYPNGVYLIKIKLDNGVFVTKKQLK